MGSSHLFFFPCDRKIWMLVCQCAPFSYFSRFTPLFLFPPFLRCEDEATCLGIHALHRNVLFSLLFLCSQWYSQCTQCLVVWWWCKEKYTQQAIGNVYFPLDTACKSHSRHSPPPPSSHRIAGKQASFPIARARFLSPTLLLSYPNYLLNTENSIGVIWSSLRVCLAKGKYEMLSDRNR